MCNQKEENPRPKIIHLIEKIPDPRIDRCKQHPLASIIFIALVTTISGADNWVEISQMGKLMEDWFKHYVLLPNGIPSHDTFGRIFSLICPNSFNRLLMTWADLIRENSDREVVAFDGKTLRGTKDTVSAQAGLHLLNAWSVDNGIAIGHMGVDAKTNEIKVTPELIKMLDLEGCIVTTDVLNTQKKTAEAIINAGADYILPVKDNHKDLLKEIQLMFKEAEDVMYKGIDADNFQTTDIDHGRFETREYYLLDGGDLPSGKNWSGLQTLGKVVRRRETRKKSEQEEAYFLTSTLR